MADVNEDTATELLTIGEFARRCGLTTKALRIYDEIGLLPPAEVDPHNAYRLYRAAQLRPARLIGMLRGAGLCLSDIGKLLGALAVDRELAAEQLDRHLAESEARHSSRRLLVQHIRAMLREDNSPMFPIQTRHVGAQRVMSIQRRLRVPELDGFVRDAKAAFAAHLQGASPIGPFTLIFHGILDYESDGPLEAVLGCPANIRDTEMIGVRTEPAHDEAFTTITKSQWDYPAILAAYDAVACSPEVAARPRGTLSCREVYLAEPQAISDDDLICDIAFPIG